MIEAILKITSENYYSCELTRKIPVKVSLIAINGPEGFGIIESLDGTEAPLKKYTRKMKQSPSIVEFEVTHKTQVHYWTRAVHEIEGSSIHETVLENHCMTRLPIIIARGFQTHTILAPTQNEFSSMYNDLKTRFTTVKIERIQRFPGKMSIPILTIKQSDAIALAFNNGYYDIPRQCELQSISKILGIKRVAMQERLRRAEKSVIEYFMQTHLPEYIE